MIPARMQVLKNHLRLDATFDLVRMKSQDAIPKPIQAKMKAGKYDSTCSVFIEVVSQEGHICLANVRRQVSLAGGVGGSQ